MTRTTHAFAFAAGLLLAATQAAAVTITFDDLADGATLANQYASLGVTFTANGFSGANTNSTTQGWAADTDMTIASLAGGNIGTLGTPALASGNVLHSFNGWFDNETGDPSFRVSFSTPVNFFSALFAGVNAPASDTAIYAFNGSTLLGTVAGTTTGQFVLSFGAAAITSVVVAPGSFADWVAVDNITFTPAPVPEPGTWALMGVGAVLLALRRRTHCR